MSNFETSYNNLVTTVVTNGAIRSTRAGPTLSLFGAVLRIDCLKTRHFPILTQRQIFIDGVLGELAGFLRGATDVKTFKDFGCNYWDVNAAAWLRNKNVATDKHQVGKIYGYQWRRWNNEVDQLAELVESLKRTPDSRRHLLTTYNPAEQADACLPPCHLTAQFNVNAGELDCIVYMRSVDLCLGLPSDIILYATLMLLLCNETGYTPGALTFMLGDTHIYMNHVDTFQQHIVRPKHLLPTYTLALDTGIDKFKPKHLTLHNYQHSGVLKYAFNN